MVAEVQVLIGGFSGLNLDDPISALDPTELSECINLDVGKGGQLVKRNGYDFFREVDAVNDVRFLGYFNTTTEARMVLGEYVNNGQLNFVSDDVTMTTVASTGIPTAGVQYTNKFYTITDTGVQESVEPIFTTTQINTVSKGTGCLVHKDRLFTWGETGQESRLRFTDIAAFGTTQSDSFIDVGQGDGDVIIGAVVFDDKIIIFKERSIWALYVQGDPSGWTLQNLTRELGCISRDGYLLFEGALYFISNESIYVTDGVGFQSISVPLEEFFKDRPLLTHLDQLVEWDYKLIAKCYDTAGTYRMFVFNMRSNAWTEWTFFKDPEHFYHCLYDAPGQGLYFTVAGDLYRFDVASYVDEGVFYNAFFSTKDFDFEQATIMKRGKWCALDVQGEGLTLLTHYADNVAQNPPLSSFPIDIRRIQKLRGPGYFRTWRFRVQVSHENKFVFYGLTLYMAPKRPVIKAQT